MKNKILFLPLFLLLPLALIWNVAFATPKVLGISEITPTPLPTFIPTLSNGAQDANNPEDVLSPTVITAPPQGCVTGSRTDTCSFYVQQDTDDGGSTANYPDPSTCDRYWPYRNEIYFGYCSDSGIRFPGVSWINTGKEILSSFIEFTADGPYTVQMNATIHGEASLNPAPYDFTTGNDVVSRTTLPQVVDWQVPWGTTTYNMGDTWALGDIRRTPDLTSILTAIQAQSGWTMGNPVSFIFKPNDSTLNHRRVIAYERASTDYRWTEEHLVVRLGTVPNHSISYYWQSAVFDNTSPTSYSLDKIALEAAGQKAAENNQPVFVILDFGPPRVSATSPGTTTYTSLKPITITDIAAGAKVFIDGFWRAAKGKKNASLYLAIGTNNTGDLFCPEKSQYFAPHGTAWGNMVKDVGAYITTSHYQTKVQVAGANDIESWADWTVDCSGTPISIASVDHTVTWAQAFASAAPTYKMFNFGSVDGNTAGGLGTTQWGADAIWLLSWGITNAFPFPEIYYDEHASQWHTIARYSAICTNCMPEQSGIRNMKFFGTLSMYCNEPASLPPKQGWRALYRDLAVDVNTDVDLESNPQVFLYSSDINYENSPICTP
jgi:hypothetical protein